LDPGGDGMNNQRGTEIMGYSGTMSKVRITSLCGIEGGRVIKVFSLSLK